MTDGLTFDKSGLDTWTGETTFDVTRERLIEYAKATNDPIATHLAGDAANPVFAIVPVFQSLMEPAVEVVPVELFGRVLHGKQDFRFHRPIRPGDTLVSKAMMTGWRGQPNGTAACVYLECRDQRGALVNEQYVTFFVRRFDTGDTVGTLGPDHRIDELLRSQPPFATVTQHVDQDQTFRYSPAAGDPMPIHLDDEVARDSGLPGIIVHGLCIQAFTAWGLLTVVGSSEVSRLQRLAVRFAKPVLPGQDLTTVIWRGSTVGCVTTYHFETTVGEEVVIKDGLAEIADTGSA